MSVNPLTPPPERQGLLQNLSSSEMAEYIQDIALELERLARGERLARLRQILRQAREEAGRIAAG